MNRRTFHFAIAALTLFVWAGCKKTEEPVINDPPDPVAGFTYIGGNKPAPHKVVFNNTSANANSFFWDFGDNQYSTTGNPTHVYQDGGSYIIMLIARYGHLGDTAVDTVIVYNRPTTVVMSALTLKEFPADNNGIGWDPDGAPDIFFTISNNTGSLFYTSEIKHNIPNEQLPLTFSNGMPFTFESLQSNYYIRFFDDDDTQGYDVIGTYTFPFSIWIPSDGSDYPPELTFDENSSGIKFAMTVQWVK